MKLNYFCGANSLVINHFDSSFAMNSDPFLSSDVSERHMIDMTTLSEGEMKVFCGRKHFFIISVWNGLSVFHHCQNDWPLNVETSFCHFLFVPRIKLRIKLTKESICALNTFWTIYSKQRNVNNNSMTVQMRTRLTVNTYLIGHEFNSFCHPATQLREGNVFSYVYHSDHRG